MIPKLSDSINSNISVSDLHLKSTEASEPSIEFVDKSMFPCWDFLPEKDNDHLD